MKIEINRRELCDLMLACTAAKICANDDGRKWKELHDKLKGMLEEYNKSNNTDE